LQLIVFYRRHAGEAGHIDFRQRRAVLRGGSAAPKIFSYPQARWPITPSTEFLRYGKRRRWPNASLRTAQKQRAFSPSDHREVSHRTSI